MNKYIDAWAVQLIHEHGRITEELKHEPYADAGDHVTTDRIEELQDRLYTIESILENHHNVDLEADLKVS
jgi:hypothetical protein